MRVAVAHGPQPVHGVALAALIPRDHARRDVHRAQRDHERRRDVFAKPRAPIEPEFVRGVAPVHTGLQRVAVAAVAQVAQHRLHQRPGRGVAHLAPQRLRPGQRARVVAGGQLAVHLQRQPRGVGAQPLRRLGDAFVAQHVGDGARQPPLPVGCRLRRDARGGPRDESWGRGRPFQRRQPRAQRRLQRDLVAPRRGGRRGVQGRILAHQRGRHVGRGVGPVQRPPAAPIEDAQHRAAEVQRLARWHAIREGDAQRHPLVERQARDVAHLHLAGQAAAPDGGVGGDAPQRRQARKQREQQRHYRRARQCLRAGGARGLPHGRAAQRQVRQHQRRQQPPHGQQRAQRRRERLRRQQRRQQREEGEEKHHVRVAARAQLQGFERQQHDDQRDPGVRPQQRAVRHDRQRHRQHGERHTPRPARQRPGLPRQPAAPHEHRGRQRARPARQPRDLQRDDAADDREQKQRVARLARQALDRGAPARPRARHQ
ncbi:hypothetical protein Ttaiw_01506 [Tepidimonas taiwanensis]|uniref:Uncharacterized protein n=1 Tax=Tepidimonas taiwanensis TaxID=307486 RepID=A0A554X6T9_9BURK|nr:hypothetical protein Ttaiw_01506 [Tepidimonas taiwanensis]